MTAKSLPDSLWRLHISASCESTAKCSSPLRLCTVEHQSSSPSTTPKQRRRLVTADSGTNHTGKDFRLSGGSREE
ncbi:unnamed protein product [Mesocestoides corti]|uniref:Secreted protein n=1 Tax=Mesocestoides corti TaxID=53468 RepID=A0A0R3U4D4_MESCO|nr:unnamed protein product [Mesocestoides corti]